MRVGALALGATSFVGHASADGSSYEYAVAGGGSIEFYENGRVKKITGPGICTMDSVQLTGFLKEFAALGAKRVQPLVESIKAPDLCYYTNLDGSKVVIFGVPLDLTRNKRLDRMLARDAGNPTDVTFVGYESKRLGPWDDANAPANPYHFNVNFEWTAANAPLPTTFGAEDPWLVITNSAPSTGGTTFPGVGRIDVF